MINVELGGQEIYFSRSRLIALPFAEPYERVSAEVERLCRKYHQGDLRAGRVAFAWGELLTLALTASTSFEELLEDAVHGYRPTLRVDELVDAACGSWRVVDRFKSETRAQVAKLRLERTVLTTSGPRYRVMPAFVL